MLKESRKTNPTFTRFCTEIREKHLTLNFSKASPTQTDKGQAKSSCFEQTLKLQHRTQNVQKEKTRAVKYLKTKIKTTRT